LPQNTYAKYSSGFDFPLGAPEGVGYAVNGTGGLNWLERYDYAGDGIAEYHPGEDWNEARNGKDYGGDNRDYGDPVYSISDGVIKYANLHSAGWGNLVLIEHDLSGVNYWSQYGHMMKLAPGISAGTFVTKGTIIGYVGSYPYNSGRNIHLHFETRKKYRQAYDFVPNWSKEKVLEYYVKPTDFINAHRPLESPSITATAGASGSSTITWAATAESEKYEIYRSENSGSCGVGTPIKTITNANETSFADQNLTTGKTYYYCLITYYKNGLLSKSAEKSVQIKQEIIKITDNPVAQTHPVISDGKIFWEDLRSENNTWPRKLYYYDLATKKIESVSIGIDGAKLPYLPNGQGTRVVFYAQDSMGTGNNIYCYDFATGNPYAITQARGDQVNPVISDSGIVVWQDLRNGSNYDLYYLDVTKSQGEIPFVIASGNQRNPAIWGNKVVWMDSRAGNRNDLYVKEIGGTEKLLATNVGDDTPSIWENYVVWQYKGKVSMVDINTGAIKTIATSGAGPSPKIRDGKVAYTLVEGANSYIHIHEIAAGKDTKIDFPLNYASFPFIFGNILVFDHAEKATVPNMDIYLVNL
jgi:beta propeller repeat protein